MKKHVSQDKLQVSHQVAWNLYDNLPAFEDVFDEDTFYVFATFFTIATIIMAVMLSRFIKLRPID